MGDPNGGQRRCSHAPPPHQPEHNTTSLVVDNSVLPGEIESPQAVLAEQATEDHTQERKESANEELGGPEAELWLGGGIGFVVLVGLVVGHQRRRAATASTNSRLPTAVAHPTPGAASAAGGGAQLPG